MGWLSGGPLGGLVFRWSVGLVGCPDSSGLLGGLVVQIPVFCWVGWLSRFRWSIGWVGCPDSGSLLGVLVVQIPVVCWVGGLFRFWWSVGWVVGLVVRIPVVSWVGSLVVCWVGFPVDGLLLLTIFGFLFSHDLPGKIKEEAVVHLFGKKKGEIIF